MKRDIEVIEVRDVAVAIVPENLSDPETEWGVYLLNMKPVPLHNVLITVSADGTIDGKERQTASLRFFLDEVAPESARKFEVILPEAFALQNRYWVSFYENGHIQDKKYILEAHVMNERNFETAPLLNKPGYLIR